MSTNTTRPEVIHDEKLLDLFMVLHTEQATLARHTNSVIGMASAAEGSGIRWDRKGYRNTEGRVVYVDEARPWAEKLRDGLVGTAPRYGGWERRAGETLEMYDRQVEVVRAAREAVRAHEVNYTGWSRFFLVTSSAGHVHSSMECTTCHATTTFAPVPSLSGLAEPEAVAVLGESLCTVCFPSAPTKPAKITQAQALKLVEQGEAEFLADRTAKAAKAATAGPDCEGSGTFRYDRSTARMGYMSGNFGVCECCGERVTLTSGNKLRKHPAKG